MTNKSDGGMLFEYNDINFAIGDVLIINCAEGTVKLNNGNTIENFNPGRFLRLQPSLNEIEYEGAACTISFLFRKVYL
jgi:phage-related protein